MQNLISVSEIQKIPMKTQYMENKLYRAGNIAQLNQWFLDTWEDLGMSPCAIHTGYNAAHL